jgi:hypothetical protein
VNCRMAKATTSKAVVDHVWNHQQLWRCLISGALFAFWLAGLLTYEFTVSRKGPAQGEGADHDHLRFAGPLKLPLVCLIDAQHAIAKADLPSPAGRETTLSSASVRPLTQLHSLTCSFRVLSSLGALNGIIARYPRMFGLSTLCLMLVHFQSALAASLAIGRVIYDLKDHKDAKHRGLLADAKKRHNADLLALRLPLLNFKEEPPLKPGQSSALRALERNQRKAHPKALERPVTVLPASGGGGRGLSVPLPALQSTSRSSSTRSVPSSMLEGVLAAGRTRSETSSSSSTRSVPSSMLEGVLAAGSEVK